LKPIWLIARRDFGAYMHGFSGYVIVAAVLFIDGLLFNAFAIGGRARLSHEILEDFFYIASGTTMIASVLLTMRSFTEERSEGTDVLLATAPVSDGQIVFGKYLASMAALSLITVLTVYMPMLILWRGKIALAHVLVGYLGLLALGAATTAIGTFGSAIARTQVAAGILSGVMVVAMLICWLLSDIVDPPLTSAVAYMALFDKHFIPFREGRLLSAGLVFYASVSFVFLWLSTQVLGGRRWQ
jgi:ABC-2 type transport system permease protein